MAATAPARHSPGVSEAARRVSAANATRAAKGRATAAKGRAMAAKGASRPRTARSGAQRRRSRTSRRRQITPIPGRLVTLGVGRTAGAVGGLADSGLVVRLTRGRLWIGLLATLLVGIVALNVAALGFNASSSKVARAGDQLRRANSALEARIAGELSSHHIQAAASKLGLALPAAGGIRYLRPGEDDAAEAARRLASGELTSAPAPAVPVAAPVPAPTEPPAELAATAGSELGVDGGITP
jgi:hypothetical protein